MLILSECPRRVSFLMAATVFYTQSFKKRVVGFLGRCLGAIPVKRPQDYVIEGKGLVNLQEGARQLIGVRTEFQSQITVGDSVKFAKNTYLVSQVISDTELELSTPGIHTQDMKYTIIPKLDQTEVYTSVHEALRKRECIGIFPEGGSHDRTELLPLKAGVCMMALGAMSRYNMQVNIQCVGLNYYHGHKFRSRSVVNFGVPYKIPMELAMLYLQDRKKAVAKLLAIIEGRMKEVWVTAPNYEELSYVFTARRVYKDEEIRKDPARDIELNRMFAKGYRYVKQKYPDNPELLECISAVSKYNDHLRRFGLKDYQVRYHRITKQKLVLYSIYSFFSLITSLIFALPGLIFTGCVGGLIKFIVEKERRKALASSSVKIQARDVIASFKIIYGIMLFPVVLGMIVLVIFGSKLYSSGSVYDSLYYTFLFIVVWPWYYYLCLIFGDRAMLHLKRLYVRALSICNPTQMELLLAEREEVSVKVNTLVNKFAEELFPNLELGKVFRNKKRTNINQLISNAFSILTEIGI